MVLFDKTIHDFGIVEQNTTLVADFQYLGEGILKGSDVQITCTCTSKSFDPVKKILRLQLSSSDLGFKQTVVNVKDVVIVLRATIIEKKL